MKMATNIGFSGLDEGVVYASSFTLGVLLVKLGEGDIDHPIHFSSRKLSSAKKNYTKTKREGLAMVYALQKF